jgi:hypothetical protein
MQPVETVERRGDPLAHPVIMAGDTDSQSGNTPRRRHDRAALPLVAPVACATSPSNTHTNATPDFGKIHPSKPTSTDGVGTDAGLRRMRGS